jgi:N-acetylglucosaminyl-diphospho-decaprenol L-rhamnosyltransferase
VTPSVDVVIPTHNGWRFTKKCLERLQAQTAGHTVTVVDNASTDGTPKHVHERFESVRVVELDSNRGFSGACNAGVRVGTGDVVVLLNNDVECRPDFLHRVIAPLCADARVASVAPLLLAPGEDLIDSVGLTVDRTLAGYPRLRGLPRAIAAEKRPLLVGPTGAAAAHRRSAWEAVGGLDERVFAYGEDVDLALRLRSCGWKAASALDAVAVHLGSASAGAGSAWQRYQGGFSRGYFLRRYGVLRRRAAPRALATEAIAAIGDLIVFSHDLAAVRGRVNGWRAAQGLPRHRPPPRDAVEDEITFMESLRLRVHVYATASASCT